jgi:hypothetical protein
VPIHINGIESTIEARCDDAGNLGIVLKSDDMPAGSYSVIAFLDSSETQGVIASDIRYTAATSFTLDPDAELRPKEIPAELPAELLIELDLRELNLQPQNQMFLPLVRR